MSLVFFCYGVCKRRNFSNFIEWRVFVDFVLVDFDGISNDDSTKTNPGDDSSNFCPWDRSNRSRFVRCFSVLEINGIFLLRTPVVIVLVLSFNSKKTLWFGI